MEEEVKTPEKMAEHLVNKKIAQAIANRMHEVKKHQAEIKKIEKEIEKIKSGELVPDAGEDSAYDQKIKQLEREIEDLKRQKRGNGGLIGWPSITTTPVPYNGGFHHTYTTSSSNTSVVRGVSITGRLR